MLGRPPRPQPHRESSSQVDPLSESVGIELVQHDHSSNLFPIIVVREHKQIGRADSGAVVVGKWSKRKQKEMSISPHSSGRRRRFTRSVFKKKCFQQRDEIRPIQF